MVKNDMISATKANRLYWLGRYEDRVYMTLHIMGKCYDQMIDGHPDDYQALWKKLDVNGMYNSEDEFTLGMLFDETNPSSVLSTQRYAMDNAMLLREDIMSESLSYLEMSMALLKRSKDKSDFNITDLQPVIDWSLAFWGSAEQRLRNHVALMIMMIGRNVENLDMLLRFGYPLRRIMLACESLRRYCREMPEIVDDVMAKNLSAMLDNRQYNPDNVEYMSTLIKYVNQLVRV